MPYILQLMPRVRISQRINIAKKTGFSNNGTRKIQFSLLDGRQNGGYNSVGLAEISKIFTGWESLFRVPSCEMAEFMYRYPCIKEPCLFHISQLIKEGEMNMTICHWSLIFDQCCRQWEHLNDYSGKLVSAHFVSNCLSRWICMLNLELEFEFKGHSQIN